MSGGDVFTTRGAQQEEERNVRRLRFVVDFACLMLRREQLSLEEAYRLIRGVRYYSLELFPGKGQAFDLIYGSRLRRILCEKYPIC